MKEEHRREIDLNQSTIASQRQSLLGKEEQILELEERLQKYSAEVTSEQKSAVLYEVELNQTRLFSLKKDLEMTVSEMKQNEGLNVETVSKLEAALCREREKAGGLSSRLGELEERMRVCVQELDMYRSLDIYQMSRESQLKAIRVARGEGLDGNGSRMTLATRSSMDLDARSPEPVDRDRRFDIRDLSTPLGQSGISSNRMRRTNKDMSGTDARSSGGSQSVVPKMPSMRDFEKAKKMLLSSSRW